jgi:hypothetical protein
MLHLSPHSDGFSKVKIVGGMRQLREDTARSALLAIESLARGRIQMLALPRGTFYEFRDTDMIIC